MSKGVAVITVNWNGWRLTLECLASLRTATSIPWHLYIVDNASSDDSIEKLQGLGDDATLIQSPVNGGWTGGNNLGLQHAIADGYEYFFLLNNDAKVEPDTLAALFSAVPATPDKPVLGALHRGTHSSDYDFMGGGVNALTGMPTYNYEGSVDVASLPQVYETSFVSGAALFIHKDHIDRIGVFDQDFYLNYDETDWCFRARKSGIPVMMVKNAIVQHAFSGTIGGWHSPLNVYFMTRNGLLFSRRHASTAQRLRYVREVVAMGRNLTGINGRVRRVFTSLFGRSRQMRAYRAGIRDYLRGRFGDCPPEIRSL